MISERKFSISFYDKRGFAKLRVCYYYTELDIAIRLVDGLGWVFQGLANLIRVSLRSSFLQLPRWGEILHRFKVTLQKSCRIIRLLWDSIL